MQDIAAITTPDPQPGVLLGSTPAPETETPTNNECVWCGNPVVPEDQEAGADNPLHKDCIEELAGSDYEPEPESEPEISNEPEPSVPQAAFDHDSPEYEEWLDKRIKATAPVFLGKQSASKAAARETVEMKKNLFHDLALKKAVLLGKGGRGSQWGPFVGELGLVVRTVDRWIEKKLDSVGLPPWVMERLNATRRPKEEKEPETTATASMAVGEDRLELVLPVTAAEKTELIDCFKLVSLEEAKQLFLQAMRKAAMDKAGNDRNQLKTLLDKARKKCSFLEDDEVVVQPEAAAVAAGE